MTPDDLARVHAAAFHDTRSWTAPEFAALLATDGVILSGDVRSFLLGRLTLDEAEILTLATDPAFQRKGLARAALREFCDAVRQAGGTRIFLEVAEYNTAAKNLYSKEYFKTIGTRKAYFQRCDGTKVAAVVMQKQIT